MQATSLLNAFLYSGGVMMDIGTLGGMYSNATGINNAGQVVGTSETSAGYPTSHAFIYSSGVITDLGTLGGSWGEAIAINGVGQVVGNANIVGDVARHAFLATPCGDGVVNSSEQCDDGNTVSGDGCSPTCTVEAGWSCTGQPSTCTSICGDGIKIGAEQCDLGPANGAADACCNTDCTLRSNSYICRPAAESCDAPESCTGSDAVCPPDALAPAGTSCPDDANLCTADVCDGEGTCVHPYQPDPNCALPATHGASLKVVSRPGVTLADQVQFKWGKGPVVPLADFGSPGSGTDYALCVYDATSSGLLPTYQGRPAGQCTVEPCWSSIPTGWKFASKSGVPDGITTMMLKDGLTPGRAKLQVKAKGVLSLETLPLQMSPHVIAQVRTSTGKCWGGTFSTAQRNDAAQFIGRSD